MNFTEIPIILLYKIMCSEFLLSSLFEEFGILIFKYLNKIHNFDEKVIILLISTLTGKTVFLKTSLRQRKHKQGVCCQNCFTGTLNLKKHCSFLFALVSDFFSFSVFGQCFSLTHQSQSRLRQLILSHKKLQQM